MSTSTTPEIGLTTHQRHRAFEAMARDGGGFLAALAAAWFKADGGNRRRIECAFPHLFTPEAFGPGSYFYRDEA